MDGLMIHATASAGRVAHGVRLRAGRSARVALIALCALAAGGGTRTGEAQTLSARLREVVYHHAPLILAETWNEEVNVEATDHILPVDFDCDRYGGNNARHAYSPASFCDRRATAYVSIVETGASSSKGYFFIGYYFYHPNQPKGSFPTPLGTYTTEVHEHDFEGVWFIVKKSAYSPYGTLYGVLTQAHDALIPFLRLGDDGRTPLFAANVGAAGYVYFWTDRYSGVRRPVVAIRSRIHGTFMAQDYTNQRTWSLHYGFGIDPRSPEVDGTYRVTIHRNTQPIVFAPEAPGAGPGALATRVGAGTRRGVWRYRLVELASSPIWSARSAPGMLLTGVPLALSGGGSALSYFNPSPGAAAKAKPVWNWLGGRGERRVILGDVAQWYSFGVDMTSRYYSSVWWPRTSPGRLLTDPAREAGLRFVGLPFLSDPTRYNPYRLAAATISAP
jgi:hypothetical protein